MLEKRYSRWTYGRKKSYCSKMGMRNRKREGKTREAVFFPTTFVALRVKND